MLHRNNITICLSLIWSLSLVPKSATAQPPPGDFWHEVALEYAKRYWSWETTGYNEDYEWIAGFDCAHFCCQIAQAGCAGMCENNNNPVIPFAPCPDYFISDNPAYCEPSPSGNHQVIDWCPYLKEWFYFEEWYDWPNCEQVFSADDLPKWVGPGTFVIAYYTDHNHAVWVGHGPHSSDPNSWVGYCHYYAHTTDRGGASGVNTLAFLMGGPEFMWAWVHGPANSPVTPPREEMEAELTKTPQGGEK